MGLSLGCQVTLLSYSCWPQIYDAASINQHDRMWHQLPSAAVVIMQSGRLLKCCRKVFVDIFRPIKTPSISPLRPCHSSRPWTSQSVGFGEPPVTGRARTAYCRQILPQVTDGPTLHSLTVNTHIPHMS